MKNSACWFKCRIRTWSSIACKGILRESSLMRKRKRHCFSSYSYLKIIYKENPIEMKNSAYWFNVQLLLFKNHL